MPLAEHTLEDKQYKEGLDYQRSMGFSTKWPEYERFKAGDQWPPATERTKSLPRPVFNIIRFILNHKIASVMNENIKMVFTPEELPEQQETVEGQPMPTDPRLKLASEGADKFTRFSETTWEDVGQDELNEEALDNAATSGSTGAWHYYWDDNPAGGITTVYKGKMAGEVIDPINLFFGNPQCKQVQKQPWIMISSREMLSAVKDKAKANKVPIEKINLIQPDKETVNEGYDGAQKELTGSEKVTVLTKYWKENGQIYFKKVASGVEIQPDTPTGFELYPLEVMSWENRKKSIFGVSEVEGLIPNQKAINFNIAMMMKSVQDTAWPKILAKVGALDQQLTNAPGEILIDKAAPGIDGVKYMNPGTFSSAAPALVDKVVELTRVFTGANEAATGDPFTKDLNAAAIIAMQNAAKVPIEQIRKRFYRSMENIGRIWEQFYKVKYNLDRRVTVKNDDGEEMPMDFKGSQYADIPMRLKIDIGPASNFSESLMMTSLDRFLDKQYITFEQYLKYSPKNVVPFKDRLLKDIQKQQKDMMNQQKQANLDQLIAQLPPELQGQIQQMIQQGAPPEQVMQMVQEHMGQMMPQQQMMGGTP